jgi:transcriptional regulator with XRE-family HTH domain
MKLLRELRVEAKLKQSELAESLGRPQSYVSKYEHGDRRLDLVELHEIAEALGVDLIELVGRYLGRSVGPAPRSRKLQTGKEASTASVRPRSAASSRSANEAGATKRTK